MGLLIASTIHRGHEEEIQRVSISKTLKIIHGTWSARLNLKTLRNF